MVLDVSGVPITTDKEVSPLLNRAAMIFKVGDKDVPLFKQYATAKHNMPVSLIMERDWGDTLENIISEECKRIYRVVIVNPLFESYFMDILSPLNPDSMADARLYRSKKAILPLETLATKLDRSDLADPAAKYDITPLVDGLSLTPSDFLDSLTYTTAYNVIEDKNTITSGDHDIGSGETYTTFAAYVDDSANQTADMKGTQTSNITETAQSNIDHNPNGYHYRITSDAVSYGYPNVGYIASINHTDTQFLFSPGGAGTYELDKFYLKHIAASSTNSFITVQAAVSYTVSIHDIMMDGNAWGRRYGILYTNATPTLYAWNIQSWEMGRSHFWSTAANANSIIENWTAYKCFFSEIIFHFANQTFKARNLVALEPWSGLCYYQYGSMTEAAYLASSDSSGTTGLTSLTSANLYNSLDDTNDEFLNITPGSTIDGAGSTTILSGNTQGIRTNARPNSSGLVSCGATESMPGSDIITLRGGFKSRLLGGFQ